MADAKAMPGLHRIEVAGVALWVRAPTMHDVRCYRGWRAAHPRVSGFRARAFVLSRTLVDPTGGGRLYKTPEDVIAALDAGLILAASSRVMALVPDN